MILTEKGRQVTVVEIQKFKEALPVIKLANFEEEWQRDMQISAINSEIELLENQVADYDRLITGAISFDKDYLVDELPHILVHARIASGMSQDALAKRLHVNERSIWRFEGSQYQGASLAQLMSAAKVLGIKVAVVVKRHIGKKGRQDAWLNTSAIQWERFPLKEMLERKWFEVQTSEDELNAAKRYFDNASHSPWLSTSLHRKRVRTVEKVDEYALLGWQVRILELAKELDQNEALPEFNLDVRWLPELCALTRDRAGIKQATQLLADHGIALVSEPHLLNAPIDGGAMLADDGRPVIGLSMARKRPEDIWRVLFHELGHVFLHISSGHIFDFFDDASATSPDEYELSAAQFAWLKKRTGTCRRR